MTQDQFEKVFNEQVALCCDVLVDKAKQYAEDTVDRLHNFNVASEFTGSAPHQVCGMFLAKHITSIYDMLRTGRAYPSELWSEKLTDALNYLFLLRAIICANADSLYGPSNEEAPS